MIDSERIDFVFEEEIRNKMADISQVNMEKMIREYSEEEVVRLMNMIIGNNVMILKLQKQIIRVASSGKKRKKGRQEDRKQGKENNEERREEKEQRR